MTPESIRKARHSLGLSLEAMATVLGYEGKQRRAMMHLIELGERRVREPQRRLVEAYLSGYRPDDWPGR